MSVNLEMQLKKCFESIPQSKIRDLSRHLDPEDLSRDGLTKANNILTEIRAWHGGSPPVYYSLINQGVDLLDRMEENEDYDDQREAYIETFSKIYESTTAHNKAMQKPLNQFEESVQQTYQMSTGELHPEDLNIKQIIKDWKEIVGQFSFPPPKFKAIIVALTNWLQGEKEAPPRKEKPVSEYSENSEDEEDADEGDELVILEVNFQIPKKYAEVATEYLEKHGHLPNYKGLAQWLKDTQNTAMEKPPEVFVRPVI